MRAMAATLGHIPDLLNRQLYIQHLSTKLGLSEGLIARSVDEAMKEQAKLLHREARRNHNFPQDQNQAPPQTGEANAEVRELGGFDTLDLANQEAELLRIIINYHDKNVVADLFESVLDAAAYEHAFPAKYLAEVLGIEY